MTLMIDDYQPSRDGNQDVLRPDLSTENRQRRSRRKRNHTEEQRSGDANGGGSTGVAKRRTRLSRIAQREHSQAWNPLALCDPISLVDRAAARPGRRTALLSF